MAVSEIKYIDPDLIAQDEQPLVVKPPRWEDPKVVGVEVKVVEPEPSGEVKMS